MKNNKFLSCVIFFFTFFYIQNTHSTQHRVMQPLIKKSNKLNLLCSFFFRGLPQFSSFFKEMLTFFLIAKNEIVWNFISQIFSYKRYDSVNFQGFKVFRMSCFSLQSVTTLTKVSILKNRNKKNVQVNFLIKFQYLNLTTNEIELIRSL